MTRCQQGSLDGSRDGASALHLIWALLAQTNDDWHWRKYLDMTEFHDWNRERSSDEKKKP